MKVPPDKNSVGTSSNTDHIITWKPIIEYDHSAFFTLTFISKSKLIIYRKDAFMRRQKNKMWRRTEGM